MLGERIRRRREQIGLTRAQLAKRCGLSETGLGNIERGRSDPSASHLRRIAHALDLTASDLVGDARPAAATDAERKFREIQDRVSEIPSGILSDLQIAFRGRTVFPSDETYVRRVLRALLHLPEDFEDPAHDDK